jgi:hypothetical protein
MTSKQCILFANVKLSVSSNRILAEIQNREIEEEAKAKGTAEAQGEANPKQETK